MEEKKTVVRLICYVAVVGKVENASLPFISFNNLVKVWVPVQHLTCTHGSKAMLSDLTV